MSLVQMKTQRNLQEYRLKQTTATEKHGCLIEKAEELSEDNFIYVFTILKELEQLPDYYIVPSQIVAKYVKKEHQDWLNTPVKKGQAHRENDMRMFRDENEEFRNKWEIFDRLLG